MMMNFKKIFIGVISLIAIVSVKGYGHHYNPQGNQNFDSQYSSGAYYCGPSCNSPYCNNSQGKWFVDAELLIWRPRLCGLEDSFLSSRSAVVTGPVTTQAISTRGREPRYKWNAGFRLGGGVKVECNDDIQLYWTHFNGRANGSRCTRGHWRLKYDVVDLTYGRRFNLCQVELRPYMGIRIARIDQRLRVLNLTRTVTNGVPGTTIDAFDFKDRFNGVAPEIGLNAVWNMGGCGCGTWSLYGDFALAAYYGREQVHARSARLSTTFVGASRFRTRACFDSVATDLVFGFGWETPFNACGCTDTTFSLRLGVEQHRIYDFNNSLTKSTLNLSGINLSANFGY